jgi:hypothetical protein
LRHVQGLALVRATLAKSGSAQSRAWPWSGSFSRSRETREINPVLRSHGRVLPSLGLVGFERNEADEPCAHAAQLRNVVLERIAGPGTPAFPQRRVDLPVFISREKRQLEPDCTALVACIAVLVLLGRAFPPVGREQRSNPVVVFRPDGNVDVVVCPRDRARVEVDRPAAEQPLLDCTSFEELVHPSQCSELLPLAPVVGSSHR